MSGVLALGEVLLADGPLTAAVEEIIGGATTKVPAVVLNRISGTELKVLSRGSKRRVSERVQATMMGRNYEEADSLLKLTRTAADATIGDFGGVTEVTINLDGTGPDFVMDDPVIWCVTQDFIVSYNEA